MPTWTQKRKVVSFIEPPVHLRLIVSRRSRLWGQLSKPRCAPLCRLSQVHDNKN